MYLRLSVLFVFFFKVQSYILIYWLVIFGKYAPLIETYVTHLLNEYTYMYIYIMEGAIQVLRNAKTPPPEL